jgi:ABC-type transport system involved in multi-copper enzyme maturation permease subunit
VIGAIASQQVLALRRQKSFLAALGMFMAMTAVAGILGWSSHNTIVRVYDEAVRLLAADGRPAPPNPFVLKPTLSMLSNMVVYVPFLGALLAIVLGHLSLADDEADGLGRLIFSRQVSRGTYMVGKLIAACAVLGVVVVAAFMVSTASLLVVNHSVPAAGDIGRLSLFYGLSWLYLLMFALIGMVAVLATRRRSLALLSAIGAWLVVTFVVPQFTSGLRPTSSLNPIIDPVSTSQRFFQITSLARPFSVA